MNWESLLPEMKKCKIIRFAQVLTGLCVEYLGVEVNVNSLKIATEDREGHILVRQVMADIMEGHLEVLKENFLQKCFRILRRFGRMWRYRSLASESYWLMVWNTFSFSSYLKRKVKL